MCLHSQVNIGEALEGLQATWPGTQWQTTREILPEKERNEWCNMQSHAMACMCPHLYPQHYTHTHTKFLFLEKKHTHCIIIDQIIHPGKFNQSIFSKPTLWEWPTIHFCFCKYVKLSHFLWPHLFFLWLLIICQKNIPNISIKWHLMQNGPCKILQGVCTHH